MSAVTKVGPKEHEIGSITFIAVTPHDVNDISTIPCRYLYVGGAGNLTVHNSAGVAVPFVAAAVGYHPISTTRVLDTGTDATNIVALF